MAEVIDIKTRKRKTTKPPKKPAVKDPKLAAAEEAVGPFAAMVLRAQEKEKGILDFDWDEYLTRLAVESGTEFDDVLEYTRAGRKRFTDIFVNTFGCPRIPNTWGELMAWDDCLGVIDRWSRHPHGLEMMAEGWPDQLHVLLAYKKGDIFTLRREHTEEVMAEITADYLAR